MSDYAGGTLAIKNHIRDNFSSLPAAQQAFDNQSFSGDVTQPYIRWSVVPFLGTRVSIGTGATNDMRREQGVVRCRLFGAPDVEEEEVMTLAVAVATLLRDQTLPVPGDSKAVRTFEPGAPVRLGNNDQGLFEVQMDTPYKRDQRA